MDESRFLAFRYPLLYLDIFILAGVAALFCLLAIWVGTGRTHWFVRAGTLVLALLALLPVQAHQPALMFAFALPAIAIAAAWLKRRGIGPVALAADAAAPGRFRFGLRDLLLAMSLIGLICLGVTVLIGRRHALVWRHIFVAAPSIWLLAMLCYLQVFARRRRVIVAIAIFFAIPAVALAEYLADTSSPTDLAKVAEVQNLSLDLAALGMSKPRIEALAGQLIAWFVFCLLLTGLLWLMRAACATSDPSNSGRRPRVARLALKATIGFYLLTTGVLYWQMVQPARTEFEDPSIPNSYPKLLEIAKRVEALNPNALSLPEIMSAQPAREFATLYRTGLQLSSQPGHLPFYAEDPADDLKINDLGVFRHLARAWRAEGESLAKNGDFAAAARYQTATVDVGAIFANRGLLVHALVGTAIERIAVSGFNSLRRELPPDSAKQTLARLIAMDRDREPHEAVVERDQMWVRRSDAWRSRLGVALAAWGRPGTTHPNDSNYRFVFQQRDATLRLLIVDLAVRLHQNEQRRLPGNLQELVPRYLPSIPLDPFSEKAIRYLKRDGDFLVYCVGLDRTDDGGRIGTRIEANSQPGFDWGLEFADELQ